MKPTRTLPEGYRLLRTVDLSKQVGLLIVLNLAGLIMFFVFGWLFFTLLRLLHPAVRPNFMLSGSAGETLVKILAVLAAYAGVLLLHELVHGVFFWLNTREAPRFGLRTAYAYAAAPEWFIPRNRYMVVGSAPLIVISLVGILLAPLLPERFLLIWWFMLTANAAGAIGDIYVVSWLLARPQSALINDHGDCMNVFVPE